MRTSLTQRDRFRRIAAALITTFAAIGADAAAGLPVDDLSGAEVSFGDDIFPVLRQNCLACHNTTRAKANLNLETVEMMRAGGDTGPAVVPGEPEASLLFLAAAHQDDFVMPPPKNKSRARNFTPRELGLLRQWIASGAEGEGVDLAAAIDWRETLPEPAPVYHVGISADGRLAAAGRGTTVMVFHRSRTEPEAALADPDLSADRAPRSHVDVVQSMAFAPDGRLVTGGFRTVKVWERTLQAVSSTETDGVGTAAPVAADAPAQIQLADGRSIEVRRDGGVTMHAEEPIGNWSAGQEVTAAAAVSVSDGVRLLVLDADGRASLWDGAAGSKIADLRALSREQFERSVAARRRDVSKELAETRRRQLDESRARVAEHVRKRDEAVAAAAEAEAAFTAAEKALAAAEAEIAELEMAVASAADGGDEAEVNAARKTLDEKTKAAESLRNELDQASKKHVAATRNRDLAERLLSEAEGAARLAEKSAMDADAARHEAAKIADEAKNLEDRLHADAIVQARFSSDGRQIIARTEGGRGIVWSGASADEIDRWTAPAEKNPLPDRVDARWSLVKLLGGPGDASVFSDRVTALAVSDDGSKLAAASGVPSRSASLSVFDMETLELQWTREDTHSDTISSLAFSPDGSQILTASSDRLVKTVSARTGDVIRSFEGHAAPASSAAWKSDGLQIVSAGADGTIRLWNAETGEPGETRKDAGGGVTAVAFDGIGGGSVLSASADRKVRLGSETVFEAADYVHGVAVSADGAIAVAGAHDGSVAILDVRQRTPLAQFSASMK